MTATHITAIGARLAANDWVVVSRCDGDDYDLCETWVIGKRGTTLTLGFVSMDDLVCLPIEKSYECRVMEHPQHSLYIPTRNRSTWTPALDAFVVALDAWLLVKVDDA